MTKGKRFLLFSALAVVLSAGAQQQPPTGRVLKEPPRLKKEDAEQIAKNFEMCACPCHTKHWLDKETGQEVTSALNINGKKYGVGPCHCDRECSAKDRCRPSSKPSRAKCVCEVRRKLRTQ